MGREVAHRLATGSSENVAAALTGDRAGQNHSSVPSSRGGLSGVQEPQPPLAGYQESREKTTVTGNVCLQACLLAQKCCDLLMETGGTREENASTIKKSKQQQGEY